ncbi:ABC transporter permease [Marispirochaeta aestuarii]|uniref:ABC transporter permease n=1 Tax=Marispirochaeta aestuarii TaxID=1963862 RepID=UPI0029C8F83D|nr:ABC transporter permease [Marispirochaeta aestuarii]
MSDTAVNNRTPGELFKSFISIRWAWSYTGVVIVFLMVAMVSRSPFQTLAASISFASFFVLVGLGQMLVITNGPGNIDLSIPYTIALAGSFAMKVMGGMDSGIFMGILAGIAAGSAVGAFNFILIRFALIPPMIATLASSFIVRTLAIVFFRGMLIKPPRGLETFVNIKILQVPILFLLVVLLSFAVHLLLTRTAYGRGIQAIGQNTKAAWLAGVKVNYRKLITYTLSGMFAGITGVLLAAFSGGATLGMGDEYLLNSIAVVVLGGTSIAGGDSNVQGIIGASVLLYLIVNLLNIIGFGASLRYIVTGVVIVGIILAAGHGKGRK